MFFNSKFFRTLSLYIGSFLWLAGCDVTGGSGDQIAGIDGSGSPAADNVTTGTIDGFGSVIVNGVRYNTDNADITISGDASSESNLDVGVYVTVVGSVNTDNVSGTATSIHFQPNVIGVISAINENQNRLVVLGQTIRVNDETSFGDGISGGDLGGLTVGQRVRVSGPVNSSEEIIASRIDLDTGSELEVLGSIKNLDSNNFTFSLGSLTIEYSQATFDGVSVESLINGLDIIVVGSQFSGGTLIAEIIEGEDDFFDELDEDGELEIEGLITEFSSAALFEVGHLSVSTDTSTVVLGGTLQSLGLDVYIQVFGSVDRNDVLQAEEIEILEYAELVISGIVTDIDAVDDGHIPIGTLQVQGNSFTANVETRYEDDSEMDIERFNLSDINVGDFVFIVGEEDNGNLIAIGIERLSTELSNTLELHGELDIEGESITLFGYVLEFTEETEFFDDDEEVTAEFFFANAEDAFVELEGELEGDNLTVFFINIFSEDEADLIED